jgi:ribonuclease D
VTELSALRAPCADPEREWIMNGADYDIVCLKRDFGIHFARIFDTVVAAQILGYPATGLAAMLQRHFGVHVSKTFQRDEWYRRPLTAEQINYALTDTRYLIMLRGILRAELEAAGRLSWAEEEFALLSRREWTRVPFTPDDFWRIRGSRDLNRRQQLVLRELAVARDERARAANRPAFKVISDQALIAVARHLPHSASQLARLPGISPLMVRRLGAPLLEAVKRGQEAPEYSLKHPPRGERRRHEPGTGRRLETLKEWRRAKAAQLGMDPGVLAPLSCLQTVARAHPRTTDEVLVLPDLSRWRAREFGAEWVALMLKR